MELDINQILEIAEKYKREINYTALNRMLEDMLSNPRVKSPLTPNGQETAEYKKWAKEYDRAQKATAAERGRNYETGQDITANFSGTRYQVPP